MKKNILTIAIAIAAITGFNASAQCPDSKPQPMRNHAEKCVMPPYNKCVVADPFDGIKLSDDQKAKIAALKADQKAKRDKCEADRKAKAEKARKEGEKKAMKAKKDWLKKMKKILTPEQYTKYLENLALSQSSFPKAKGGKFKKFRPQKFDGKMNRKFDGKRGDMGKKNHDND